MLCKLVTFVRFGTSVALTSIFSAPRNAESMLRHTPVPHWSTDKQETGAWGFGFDADFVMVWGEMVASSRIESVNAPLDMIAAASLGVRVHVNARLVAAAGDATRALSGVADRRHLEADDLLAAHRTLLAPLAVDRKSVV